MSSVQPGKLPELEPIQVPDPDLPLLRRLPAARAGLFAAVLVALVLIVIGAVVVHAQLNALKNELSGVRRELISARDRIAQLERKVVEEPARQANEAARRVEERPRLELPARRFSSSGTTSRSRPLPPSRCHNPDRRSRAARPARPAAAADR